MIVLKIILCIVAIPVIIAVCHAFAGMAENESKIYGRSLVRFKDE